MYLFFLFSLNVIGTGPFSEVSPFILLTLKYPVEGVEGALLRSLLDIDCLNSLTHEQSTGNLDACSCLKGFHTPVLSLDDSVELIRRTGLGSHLLSLLGLQTADSRPGSDQDGPHSDTDNDGAAHIQLQVETQAQTELEREAEKDPKTQLKPDQVQVSCLKQSLPDKYLVNSYLPIFAHL